MIFLGRSEKEPFSPLTDTPQRPAGIQSQPVGIQSQPFGSKPEAAGIQQVQTQQAQHRIGRKSGVIQPLGLLTNQGAKLNQPEIRSPQPEVSRSAVVQPEVRTPVNPTSVTIKKVPQSKQDLSRTNRLGSLIQIFVQIVYSKACLYRAHFVMLLCVP